MIEALIVFQLRSDAYTQALTIVGVSLLFILLMSIAAFVVVRMVNRSLRVDSPYFSKDAVMRKRAELLALAKKKKVDRDRAEEMASRVPADKGQTDKPSPEQVRKDAQEAAREKLKQAATDAVGSSCPHCHIAMAADEELAVCPSCLAVQHRVCLDLSGCINGCVVDYIYEYPPGTFRDLGTTASHAD
jgi:hypothetical protein